MAYLSSSIELTPTGLYKARIFTSKWFFFIDEEHETFKTLQEARDWLLHKRCPNCEISENIKTPATFKSVLMTETKNDKKKQN